MGKVGIFGESGEYLTSHFEIDGILGRKTSAKKEPTLIVKQTTAKIYKYVTHAIRPQHLTGGLWHLYYNINHKRMSNIMTI